MENVIIGKTAMVDCEHGKCSDIIVPRNLLIEKINKIEDLETQLSQQVAEHTFELGHSQKIQSLELQKTCEKYEKMIVELTNERKELELKYREERNMIKCAIEEKNADHSTAVIQLEAKLNEKILAESDKLAALNVKMDSQKNEYEILLFKGAEYHKDTTKTLEQKFKEQISEQEKHIKMLLDEIQTKKEEFFEYCSELNLDNDRKIAQLNLSYETRLMETNDNLMKWRTDASILTKKIENTSTTCDQLRTDISILLDEHGKNKKYISQLEQNCIELQRDIDVRNKLVNDKEKCLLECIEKNATTEKVKKFLNERAIQLESQIKPLDDEIKLSTCKIIEMDDFKKKLLRKVDGLNIEIHKLTNRCNAIGVNLKFEQIKNHHSETIIKRMYSDISFLVQHIQDLPKLKELSLLLFKTYVC